MTTPPVTPQTLLDAAAPAAPAQVARTTPVYKSAPQTPEPTQQAPKDEPVVEPVAAPAPASEPAKSEAVASYELKTPEGLEVSGQVTKTFAELAQKHGISLEAAQAVFAGVLPSVAASRQAEHAALVESWKTAASKDSRFGGPDQSKAVDTDIDAAVSKLGSPDLDKLLTDSGLRNHPEIRAFLRNAGKAVREDSLLSRGGPSTPGTRTLNGASTHADQAARMPYRRS